MKIGILGAGGIAVQMAKTVAGMKDVENYAVAARSLERAQAFGADAVLIGRPFCLAAVGGGSEGVKLTADHLYNQLVRSMVLTGCPSVREAGRHLVSTAPLA